MEYRIDYGHAPEARDPGGRRIAMTMGALVLFLVLVVLAWPEGCRMLQQILLPGDRQAAAQALEELAMALEDGAPLSEAVGNFCRQVITGG